MSFDGASEAEDRIRRALASGSSEIDLNNLGLNALPKSLLALPRLQKLAARRNRLEAVPEWLGRLRELRTVDIAHNKLKELPDQIENLVKLTSLDASKNQLTEIPSCISRLHTLDVLDLDGNLLTYVPDSIAQIKSLTALHLGHNLLTELPETMSSLTSLKLLYLSGNALAVLPAWLKRLSSLEGLYVNDNVLTELPSSVGELPKLFSLDCRGNKLIVPPPEVAEQGEKAVISYMQDLSKKGEEQWVSKLIVAGEAKVGKTSLIKALRGKLHDPHEPMTHDIVVSDLALEHPTRKNVTMHLSAWDFGGQRTYRSAHRFYMTDRSLFLLVFDCREEWSDSQMREWLKAIMARAASSPIILVGTNSREHRTGLPIETLRADFPQVYDGVFYVDCDDRAGRIGIPELYEAIRSCTANLPLMGARWPDSWLAAVKAVSLLPGNYATVEAVDDAMATAGLAKVDTRTTLLAALHHRGDVLHFADEPELADTVVLHPTWVDGHVTKILDSASVYERSGVLSRTELDKLWARTPAQLMVHLTGLMEAFDLAYRIDSPDHDDVCIIVDRLPHDPPDYGPTWRQTRELHGANEVRIVVDFGGPGLLAGIPTWFIAREHRFTTEMHWRYGVLLVDRFDTQCYALLVADEQRGQVELTVRGTTPIGFLSVLKDGFLSPLRQRYPRLNWTIKIPCSCASQGEGTDPCA